MCTQVPNEGIMENNDSAKTYLVSVTDGAVYVQLPKEDFCVKVEER